MASPVAKVEIASPPAYDAQQQTAVKQPATRAASRYLVGGVVIVILVTMVIGAALCGVYLQNKHFHSMVKEFSSTVKDAYGKVHKDTLKIDAENNEDDERYEDDSLRVINDYSKGITAIRTKVHKLACFLKPLNKTGITEPKALRGYLDKIQLSDKVQHERDPVVYKPGSDPVEDRSFLSTRTQDMCRGLDVYWMFPTELKAGRKRYVRCVTITITVRVRSCFLFFCKKKEVERSVKVCR